MKNLNFDLHRLLPRASKSFLEANPPTIDPSVDLKTFKTAPGVILPRSSEGRRGRMNRTEAEFALQLEARKRAGEIRDYLFHPLSLPWAGMKYTPDFMVTPNSGLEKRIMIEVKGPHIHYRQQALARFKGARGFWPEFTFELWQKTKEAGWKQII